MNKDSLQILKNFTKKLSNCQHNVKISEILEYLKDGKFGYSVSNSGEVIVNEYAFADDILLVINQMRAIVKNPHVFLKKENTVQHVSIAPNMDTETLLNTYQDDKLWRVNGNSATPEFVHSFVNEDTLAIYENRFITGLIDLIYGDVSKRLSALLDGVKTLNGLAGLNALEGGFSANNYFDLVDANNGEIPVVANYESAEIKTISLLMKCKKQLAYLKQTEFYSSCKKAGAFNVANVKPTNILTMDKKYNYCYVFYNNYVKAGQELNDGTTAFVNYATLNLLQSILNLGFTLQDAEKELLVKKSGKLVVVDAVFTKEPFAITVNKAEDSAVLDVKVSLSATASNSKYAINVLGEEEFDNFDKTFKISSQEKDGFVLLVPSAPSTIKNLDNLVRSMLIICEVSIGIHSKICPICGSSLISPDDTDIFCSSCLGKYHLYSFGKKEYAWIKTLPSLNLNLADREEEIAQEVIEEPTKEVVVLAEEIVTTEVEEPINQEIIAPINTEENDESVVYIDKSFIGKLTQSTDDVKEFYAEVRNYIMSFKGVKGRVSWQYDSFNMGRRQLAKLVMRGKTLCLCLAINPDGLERKYFAKDVRDIKKFNEVPSMVKVKSSRGVMYAKQLIDMLLEGVDKDVKYIPEEYDFKYVGDKTLIRNGLAKAKLGKKIKF